MSEIEQKKV